MNATTKPETLASLKKTRSNLYNRIQQLTDMRSLQTKMHGDFPECEIFRKMAAELVKIEEELLIEYRELNKKISARGGI